MAEAHSLDDLEVGDLISELLRQGDPRDLNPNGDVVLSRYVQIGCVKSRKKNLLKTISYSYINLRQSYALYQHNGYIWLYNLLFKSFVSNSLGVSYVKARPGSRGLEMMIPRFGCSGWCSVRCWQEPNFCGGDEMGANGRGVVGAF